KPKPLTHELLDFTKRAEAAYARTFRSHQASQPGFRDLGDAGKPERKRLQPPRSRFTYAMCAPYARTLPDRADAVLGHDVALPRSSHSDRLHDIWTRVHAARPKCGLRERVIYGSAG